MSVFYKNFVSLCAQKGDSETTVIQNIGNSTGVLWRWKKGSIPQNPTLLKIADYFNVTPDYLLADHSDPDPESLHFRNARPADTPENESRLPVYGSISAGRGILAEQDIIGWAYADEDYLDGQHFWLSVSGVSMEPELKNGDLVLIRKQPQVDSGQIGAFIYGGEGFIKKFISDGDIRLHSLNPVFPDIVITPETADQFTVIGKVVEARHKYA